MIVFDLQCTPEGHRFEGWFGSSGDYADQQARGLLACPVCGSAAVGKAVMAPAVGRKGNQAPVRAEPDKSGPEGAAPAAPSAPAPAAPPAPLPLPPEAVRLQPPGAESVRLTTGLLSYPVGGLPGTLQGKRP